jgi:hypothetical protein
VRVGEEVGEFAQGAGLPCVEGDVLGEGGGGGGVEVAESGKGRMLVCIYVYVGSWDWGVRNGMRG